MKIFKLDEIYSVICKSEATRSGFRHIAYLMKHNYEIAKTKICYYNRTWEAYEFEDVLIKLINDNFTDNQKDNYLNIIKFK